MIHQLRLACGQFDPKIALHTENLNTMESIIQGAGDDCDLIVFPEAAITGYCFANEEETRLAAIEPNGPQLARLQEMATARNLSIVVGAVIRDGLDLYNSVFFLEPDGTRFRYDKSHLPFLGVDRFVKPGCLPCAVFDTRFGKIGIIVCYELRFPETARLAALQGARLILQPTNLPQGGESHPAFLTRARACENRVYFASCNRIGTERGFQFIGRSQILDFNGDILDECHQEDALISAQIDLRRCENKDIISAPGERELYLYRHRRWDLYASLSAMPDALGFLPKIPE